MRIACLAVGKLKSGAESELCARYLERARNAGRPLGFRGFEVVEVSEARALRPGDRVDSEARAIQAALDGAGRVVCLDAAGALADSAGFAAGLRRDADAGSAATTFVIGGPDGLGSAVLDRCDRQVSFGRLTWPHQIVRVMLAEQLYRAMTILSGHPYHRA